MQRKSLNKQSRKEVCCVVSFAYLSILADKFCTHCKGKCKGRVISNVDRPEAGFQDGAYDLKMRDSKIIREKPLSQS